MHRVTFRKRNVMSECERKHKNIRISKNEMTNKQREREERGGGSRKEKKSKEKGKRRKKEERQDEHHYATGII